MLRLLNIELQKLLLSKVCRVLIFISFLLPFFVITLSALKINFFGLFSLRLGDIGIFNFPIVWHVTTFFASQFKFFFAIVVVSMIGNEYSNKTLKQNLIDGLSKKEFICSKFYAILFFSVISTILIALITLGIGFYYSSYTELSIVLQGMEFLLAYFIKLLGFFSLCLFLGLLVKRSAFALAFLFVLFLAEWIIYALIGWQSNFEYAEKIQNYFPLKSMYNLIDQPLQRIAKMQYPNSKTPDYDYAVHGSEIIIVLLWTAVFIVLSYRILKKRDL